MAGISVVVPVYNEAQGVDLVLQGLYGLLAASGRDYEIIVVDDGSTDGTLGDTPRLPVRLIRHSARKGYGAALKTGIRAARYKTIVTMDGDGQHNPADALPLVELARTHDMVVGARTRDSHVPHSRRPGKWLLTLVASYLAGVKIPDLNSGFRVFQRDIVLRFAHILPDSFSFSTTLTLALLKEGYNVAWCPITTAKRTGNSTVNPLVDGYNTMLLIIRTIVLFDPLKVFLPSSLFLGTFGVLGSIYALIRYRAFPETGVLVILTAVLLFFFGVLADQVSALRRGLSR